MTVVVEPGSQVANGIEQVPFMLIVDDDISFRVRLSRAMEARRYHIVTAQTASEAKAILRYHSPQFAVIDMRLEDGNGLDLVPLIHESNPTARVVMLTGYGNIATAIVAIKTGAVDYLSKPASTDEIIAALEGQLEMLPPPPDFPMSADRVRWEHIHRVFEQCGRNVSETARKLRMHRRTLQRILNKNAPRT